MKIMAYKKIIYAKAKEILQQRKQKAEKDQEIRHSEVLMNCPAYAQIDREVASYGAKAIQAVGMGADAERYVRELGRKSILAQEKRSAVLMNAGYPADFLDVKYICTKCKDTGTFDGYRCECYKKLVIEVAKKELAKSAPLEKSTFESFSLDYYEDIVDKTLGLNQKNHMSAVFNYCHQYAKHFTPCDESILMLGQTGLGKTHLSLAIANTVIERGFDVHYDTIQNIMDKLEKIHFKKANYDYDVKDELLNCQLLIIDDLGVEFITQFTIAEFNNIINTRVLKGYSTIINTNLSLEELENTYGPRIASRLIGASKTLYFCGKDIRQKKRKNFLNNN